MLCMESKGSLLCSQVHAIGPYPELVQSTTHPLTIGIYCNSKFLSLKLVLIHYYLLSSWKAL